MAIVLPHIFQDGVNETASGVQVNENNSVLIAAIEAIEAWRAGPRKSAWVHHPATEALIAGTNVHAGSPDAVTVVVPAGGCPALISASVGLVKAGGVNPKVQLSPVVIATGGALVGESASNPPILDTLLTLGSSGFFAAGLSGSGNFADAINAGLATELGGVVVWLPEGSKTLELLYTRGQEGDTIHNRFLSVALLGP